MSVHYPSTSVAQYKRPSKCISQRQYSSYNQWKSTNTTFHFISYCQWKGFFRTQRAPPRPLCELSGDDLLKQPELRRRYKCRYKEFTELPDSVEQRPEFEDECLEEVGEIDEHQLKTFNSEPAPLVGDYPSLIDKPEFAEGTHRVPEIPWGSSTFDTKFVSHQGGFRQCTRVSAREKMAPRINDPVV